MPQPQRKAKAVLLHSGGLDSCLACTALLRAGVEVVVLRHHSIFYPLREGHGYSPPCEMVTREVSAEMVELVREPRYGLGKNANPCLDCKQMMYGKAWEEAQRQRADFIATGEVLGQRPMSQNVGAFRRMEKGADVWELVVRPLSGRLLPPTVAEQRGLLSREDMLDFQGRTRKPQMELAARWGIEDYPTPAGGCKLTDPQFARRVFQVRDMGLLSVDTLRAARSGRFFPLDGRAFALVGRNHQDNLRLLQDAPPDSTMLELRDRPGPMACVVGRPSAEDLEVAKRLVVRYSRFRDLPAREVRTGTVAEARAWQLERAEHQEGP